MPGVGGLRHPLMPHPQGPEPRTHGTANREAETRVRRPQDNWPSAGADSGWVRKTPLLCLMLWKT